MSVQTENPLPTAKDVRDLFEGLLGREVVVHTGGIMVDPAEPAGALVGTYVDPFLKLKAICLFDLPLAAFAGAAIGLIPAPVAKESVQSDMLDPALEENAREVLNVLASLMNAEDVPHVKLDRGFSPREALPADVVPWVKSYVRRQDLTIEVAGYGKGCFSLLVL